MFEDVVSEVYEAVADKERKVKVAVPLVLLLLVAEDDAVSEEVPDTEPVEEALAVHDAVMEPVPVAEAEVEVEEERVAVPEVLPLAEAVPLAVSV